MCPDSRFGYRTTWPLQRTTPFSHHIPAQIRSAVYTLRISPNKQYALHAVNLENKGHAHLCFRGGVRMTSHPLGEAHGLRVAVLVPTTWIETLVLPLEALWAS